MNQLEKWFFPAQSVLSGERAEHLDLTHAELRALPWLRIDSQGNANILDLSSEFVNQSRLGFEYEMPISDWIHQLKYGGKMAYCRLLSELFLESMQQTRQFEALQNVDAIVPVPIHLHRYRQRGFNQATCLAKQLGKRLQLPVIEKAVQRVVDTPPQAQMDRQQRQKNIHAAFEVNAKYLQGVQRIALLDDVLTTGATLGELAKQMRAQSQLEWIEAWAIAKVI